MNNQIYRFLTNIDQDFPTPLSKKTDLKDYANKILSFSNFEYKQIDNKIVGMVIGYIDNCENNLAYISIVGVLKEYRGQHIAESLLSKFIKECEIKKIKQIHLYTSYTNKKAIQMYTKFGFYEKKLINEPRKNDMHLFYNVSCKE